MRGIPSVDLLAVYYGDNSAGIELRDHLRASDLQTRIRMGWGLSGLSLSGLRLAGRFGGLGGRGSLAALRRGLLRPGK